MATINQTPKIRYDLRYNESTGKWDIIHNVTSWNAVEDTPTTLSGYGITDAVAKVTSTDNAVARFDGTTGSIQNSNVSIADTGSLTIGGTWTDTSANNPYLSMGGYARLTGNTSGAFTFAPNNTPSFLANTTEFRPISGTANLVDLGSASYGFRYGYFATGVQVNQIYTTNNTIKRISAFASSPTATYTYTLPNSSGTVALTSDIPTLPTFADIATDIITSTDNAIPRFNGTGGKIESITNAPKIDDSGNIVTTKNIQVTGSGSSLYLSNISSSIHDTAGSKLIFGTPGANGTVYSYLAANNSGAFALAKDSSHGFVFYPGGTYSCLMPNFAADLGRNDTDGTKAWRHLYTKGNIYKYNGSDSFYTLTIPSKTGTLAVTSDIPSVSNATITVKQTGISDQTFTLNGSATTITLADTTYESKVAASGGTAVSLVTTGEKYTWNDKVSAASSLANGYIVVGQGNKNVATSNKTITDLVNIAEGKTATYVIPNKACICDADGVATEDSNGNFEQIRHIYKVSAANGEEYDITSMHVGDNILIQALDVPDYWVSDITTLPNNAGVELSLSKLETTKVDLTDYVTTNTSQSITGQKAFTSRPTYTATRLPSSYQEVEYLNFDGTSGYVNTGIVIDTADNLTITMKANLRSFNASKFATLFGYMAASTTPRCAVSIYQAKYMIGINATNSSIVDPTTGIHNYKFYITGGNQILEVDGTSVVSTTVSSSALTGNTLSTYVGARNGAGTANNFADINVYSFKVVHNGNVYNLVPCYRKSDDNPGFYDIANDTFLPATGTVTAVNVVEDSEFLVFSDLAEVATSGSFNDLKDKPTNHVINTTTVTGTGALGGGGNLTTNRTITHNAGSVASQTSGFYKFSTDAYSHIGSVTAVVKGDLTDLIGNESAASGGSTLSLVTTGEKYTWDNKLSGSDAEANYLSYTNVQTLTSTQQSNLRSALGLGTASTTSKSDYWVSDFSTSSTTLSNNTDLNTIVTPGSYSVASASAASTMTNGPETTTGYAFQVVKGGGGNAVYQIAYVNVPQYNGANGFVWIRARDGNNSSLWHPWVRYAMSSGTFTNGRIPVYDTTLQAFKDSGKTTSDFATSGHTHNYAGSTSAGGDASQAVQVGHLLTFRVTESQNASGTFNGGENLDVQIGNGLSLTTPAEGTLVLTTSSTIPTTYVSTVNGSSGAITNVAKTDVANTFTEGQKITRSSSGAILELESSAADTNFLLKRTSGATCVLESGSSVGLFGTKSNHSLQVRTNYVNRMTFDTSGGVTLATDVASNSNSNQLATTKWVNAKGYVPSTRTIAGIDLADNITSSEMITALSLDNVVKSSNDLTSGKIVVGQGNKSVATSTYSVNDLKDIAEGKTASYVIEDIACICNADGAATANSNGNFTGITHIYKVSAADGQEYDITSMHIGDNILIKSLDVPDYWVSAITELSNNAGVELSLSKLETTKVTIGTLDTTQTTAQSTNNSESLSGSIKLHKVAKTGSYADLNNTPSEATTSVAGLMSASDKIKLDGIATGATANTGTVTSVQVQAGTGLVSSQNTAQSTALNTTISVDSNYKLPTTSEWNNQDIDSWQADYTDTTNNFSAYRSCLANKKIYTGVIGVANGSAPNNNTYANTSFYFLTVHPISWDAQWSIKYRLNIHLDDENQKYRPNTTGTWEYPGQYAKGTYDCSIQGTGGAYNTFHFFQSQKNTSYRPIYYHMLHNTTADGYNAGYGHKIGVSLASSYRPTPVTDYSSGSAVANTKYTRTIEVILDECVNCTVTLNDALEVESDAYRSDYTKLPATISVNGSTKNCYTASTSASNSAGRWINLAATTQGLYESGDDNTYTYTQSTYNYLTNGTKNNGTDQYILGYSLIGFDKDGKALAISRYSSSQTTYTTSMSVKGTRLYCDVGFDYTKGIRYINSSSNFAGGGAVNISPTINHSGIDLRYSDNCVAVATSTTMGLLNYYPVYLRGTIGSDGLFYLAPIDVTYNNATYQRAWVQERDGFEAGYVYWFIGYPYYNGSYLSGYQFNLYSAGGLVEYKDGQLKPYLGTEGTVTSVSAGTGLSISGTSTVNPTVNVASGYKLPTTTEWNNIPSGTVTSVQVQAGTGLTSSTNTAQSQTLSTTISIDSNYKLPTTTEWNAKLDTAVTKLGTRTGDITIDNLKSDLGLGSNAYTSTNYAGSSTAGGDATQAVQVGHSFGIYAPEAQAPTISFNGSSTEELHIGSGLNLSNYGVLTNALKTGYTTDSANRNYQVKTDTSGNMYVNVPWENSTGFIPTSQKGANSGVAELDANGKVPSSQLPSYVDDVINGYYNTTDSKFYTTKSGSTYSTEITGETGKIYIDLDTNKTYRWNGSDAFVEISASLALGTTSSTAFRGDYGNSAYTHAVTNKGSAFESGWYKITTNSEGHVTAATAVAKSDITGLLGNYVYSVATSGTGLSGGTITSSGTITLKSSSDGNASSTDYPVVLRNANGSIQTEKVAISSGTTTKATMQYDSTNDCVKIVF